MSHAFWCANRHCPYCDDCLCEGESRYCSTCSDYADQLFKQAKDNTFKKHARTFRELTEEE